VGSQSPAYKRPDRQISRSLYKANIRTTSQPTIVSKSATLQSHHRRSPKTIGEPHIWSYIHLSLARRANGNRRTPGKLGLGRSVPPHNSR